MREITRDQVAEIAAKLAAHYGERFTDRWFPGFEPTVIEGAHEMADCDWALSWEECPDDGWVWSEALGRITSEVTDGQFFNEAINHWSVGFYAI